MIIAVVEFFLVDFFCVCFFVVFFLPFMLELETSSGYTELDHTGYCAAISPGVCYEHTCSVMCGSTSWLTHS